MSAVMALHSGCPLLGHPKHDGRVLTLLFAGKEVGSFEVQFLAIRSVAILSCASSSVCLLAVHAGLVSSSF